MTPAEREKLDTEIYLETKNYRGCIEDAADFLRHRDSSRISRLINPNDSRANNIFGEMLDVLQGFNHRHPKLAEFIWEKLTLAKNSFMGRNDRTEEFLTEIADLAAREQLDVNFAVSRRASQQELEREAFQAFERSRIQYEAIVAMRGGSIQSVEKEQ